MNEIKYLALKLWLVWVVGLLTLGFVIGQTTVIIRQLNRIEQHQCQELKNERNN